MISLRRTGIPDRSGNDRVVGGVCGGLAAAVHLDARILRVAAVVLAAIGPGIPIYLIAWLVMPKPAPLPVPPRPGEPGSGTSSASGSGAWSGAGAWSRAWSGAGAWSGARAASTSDDLGISTESHRSDLNRKGVGLGLLVLGSAMTARELDLAPPDSVVLPVLLVGLGLGVVMWQLQPRLDTDRWVASRIAAGVVVVGAGVSAFIAGNVSFGVIRDGLLATLLVTSGLGLIIGPWMAVLIRSRQDERHRRLQADARSDMAAHLHDSVLQTFAMIQRADDPKTMSGLARRQERELRRWLYGGGSAGEPATLESAVETMAAAAEELHGLTVEAVVVGDRGFDPSMEALLAAASEAVTNAAKWSGSERVSVFVEAAPDGVHAYVRDTGAGFDPSAVAPDRLGLRESIHGRMDRVGGTAEVTTQPGAGTEVHLFVPAPRSGH